MRQGICLTLSLGLLLAAIPEAHAASIGGGLPWEGPLQEITDSVSGPILRTVFILSIIIAGATMALVDLGQGAKAAFRVVFGLSIAVAAVNFFPGFLGFNEGAAVFG